MTVASLRPMILLASRIDGVWRVCMSNGCVGEGPTFAHALLEATRSN